jgi:hypothetical protein
MRVKTTDGYYFDSFDRFGDDLCQLLLSYLSISHKIRFECVSKQWQRLVFNKQNKIVFSYYAKNNSDILKNIFLNNSRIYYSSNKFIRILDPILVEKAFKKFKFITEVVINYEIDLNSEILELIAKNFPHLKKFISTAKDVHLVSVESLRNFGERLAQSLEHIRFDNMNVEEMTQLLKPMKSLKAIHFYNSLFSRNEFIPEVLENISNLSVNIEELAIFRYNSAFVKSLADNYCVKLRKLSLYLTADEKTANKLSEALIQLSRFERLEKFNLNLWCPQKGLMNKIDKSLIIIAKNCSKLKILSFSVSNNLDLISGQLFKIMSEFKTLQKLSLWYSRSIRSCGPIESFKSMVKLKFLRLYVLDLNRNHFEEFSKHCPHIKVDFLNNSINQKSRIQS